MHNKSHLKKAALLGVLILALSIVGVALAADSVVVEGFTIDFLGVEEMGDGHTTQWTYAVTEREASVTQGGLSHWTLGIAECGYQFVDPIPGSTYDTDVLAAECGGNPYLCTAAIYNVVQDDFGTFPGLTGIKFNYDSGDQLNGGDPQHTHIFRISLYTDTGKYEVGDTDILVKIGGGPDAFEKGLITGPVCPSSAVNLVSLGAGKNQLTPAVGLVTFLAVVLVGGGAYAFSRRQS